MRHKTFNELWADLAVVPSCRHHGIGKALLLDGIRKGESLGYDRVALVAD